jgi:glyoxylate/hydroxypyruvate reductase A
LLRAALPHAQVSPRHWAAPVDPDALPADYVVAYGKCDTLFDEQRRMKAVFTLSAGVGHLLKMPNVPRDVPIIRLEDAGMAEQMVRYVLAAALRFAQRFDVYARQQRDRVVGAARTRAPSSIKRRCDGSRRNRRPGRERLSDQGFAVRGFARSKKTWTASRSTRRRETRSLPRRARLPGLRAACDAATEGILNRATLSRLADGAHFVNIGRGAALVEEDLVALVASGKLGGATLDVFRKEPLPADHPFWRCPEIVVTPHISGLTVPGAAITQIADKIMRLERGEPVSGVVAFERGY